MQQALPWTDMQPAGLPGCLVSGVCLVAYLASKWQLKATFQHSSIPASKQPRRIGSQFAF
jgi:hypothetical protein